MSLRDEQPDCERYVDAAPYVLGALEDPELYREHLAECASCQAEVAELQVAVDMLPATVAPEAAPEPLRQRVLATVRSEAELLNAAGPQADRPPRPAARWRSWESFPTAWVALAASAAAVVAIVLNVGSSAHERVTSGRVAASIPGGHASLRQIDGRSELVVAGMPQPPPGKIYEVWLARGAGAPQATDALFSVTSRGSGSVSVPSSLHGVKEVMVTSEPLGGSVHPTSAPLIRVSLRA